MTLPAEVLEIVNSSAAQSIVGKMFTRVGVLGSPELRRVKSIPWREWSRRDIDDAASLLTARLKTPEGTQRLHDLQAMVLCEMYDHRGLLGPIGVGHGKTLISLLLPVVMGSRRPLLLIPANMREDLLLRMIPDARKHWKIAQGLTVMTYEELSRHDRTLEHLDPDLIILDEAHSVRDSHAARTKKFYQHLRRNPQVLVCFLSGTIASRSLHDFEPMLRHTHGERRMPLPSNHPELKQWSRALDEKIENRVAPGALLELAPKDKVPDLKDDDNDYTRARKIFSARLFATPGIVGSTDSAEVKCSLLIREVERPVSRLMQQALDKLRTDKETPEGDPLVSAIEVWSMARELACGFFYKWDPAPPPEWMQARREWAKFVYETLKHSRSLFSRAMVANACIAGKLDGRYYFKWAEIEPTFKPKTVPVWFDRGVVDRCAEWLHKEKGLVWVEHRAFGEALQAVSGVPYFAGGKASARALLAHSGPAILSLAAFKQGKNLQAWNRNLFPSPAPSGKWTEQVLGRTHRPGQVEDVIADVMLGVTEVLLGFAQACKDARFVQDTMRSQQKLCLASWQLSAGTRKDLSEALDDAFDLHDQVEAFEQEQDQVQQESQELEPT